MTKVQSSKSNVEVSFCKSALTLTFALEVLGPESWQLQWLESKDETLELGPCEHGIKLQYQLYYGQNFDIDIAIWQNVAKVYCGSESCWVRVWQFLQRRWLTFTIRHAFPVRVEDLRVFEAIVTPSVGVGVLGSNAKGDKSAAVTLPPLEFGERRYFARVVEDIRTERQKWLDFVREYIWDLVKEYIPKSFLDGQFDVPMLVTDIRHQDAVLTHIQDEISNRNIQTEYEEDIPTESDKRQKASKEKPGKEKDAKKKGGGGEQKTKFGARLSGNALLAGTGRVVAFECFGQKPMEMGAMIVLLSSSNLPAPDDKPIVFVNINSLFDAPLEEFRKLRITHLYTRWHLGNEVHDSEPVDIRSKRTVNVDFKDHYCIPLEISKATELTSQFLEHRYHIEVRGIRELEPVVEDGILYGYDKRDREIGNAVAPKLDEQVDFMIAITRIEARTLSKGINAYIDGEYPLFPPLSEVSPLDREPTATNDINLIGRSLIPRTIVSNSTILASQMTLKVSMGIVGCRPPRLTQCYSRLYFLSTDEDSVMTIVIKIGELNENLFKNGCAKEEMLTGFSVDMGNVTMLFLEGPKDRHILSIWDMTEEFYPKIKPLFSSTDRYARRIYDIGISKNVPFVVLKMHAPLHLLLACPTVYARPALPLPTRKALLKLGRLVQNRFRSFPHTCDLPSVEELRSFRLELCAPHRTFVLFPQPVDGSQPIEQSPESENKLVNKNIIWHSNVP